MAQMKLDNARNARQKEKMEECIRLGRCPFCIEWFSTYHDAPVLYETDHWLITANDDPYTGAEHHYLIISKRHLTRMTELMKKEEGEFFHMIHWLQHHLEVVGKGFAVFVRNGDMAYTGATLDHLHFHFLMGAPKPADWKGFDDNITVTLGHKKKTP